MESDKLYNAIKNDLERYALKKFDSKRDFNKWSQNYYENKGYKAFGLRVPK